MRSMVRMLCASIVVVLMVVSGFVILGPVEIASGKPPGPGVNLWVSNIWWVDSYGTSYDVNPGLTSGQPFNVLARIQCEGNRNAGPFYTSLTIDTTNYVEMYCSGLSPDSWVDLSWNYIFLSPLGSKSATVYADSRNQVSERIETDNARTESFSIVAADWTIAVVLNGDSPMMFSREQDENSDFAQNDLEEFAIDNFVCMADQDTKDGLGGSSPKVSVVVMMDMRDGVLQWSQSMYALYYYDGWTDTRLYFVTPGLVPWSSYALPNSQWPATLVPGEQNLGDPNVISAFGNWAFSRFVSTGTFFVIAGFGEGWMGLSRDIAGASDVTTTAHDEMTPAELASATTSISQGIGKKIDVLGMDSLFMSQIEAVDGLSSSVDYCVAAPLKEPEVNTVAGNIHHSWPYQRLIDNLKNSPDKYYEDLNGDGKWQANEIGAWMADSRGPYATYYNIDPSKGSAYACAGGRTIASFECSGISAVLVAKLNNLANGMIAKMSSDPAFKQTILTARQAQNSYVCVNDGNWYLNAPGDTVKMHRYCDIGNFASALGYETTDSTIEQLCDDLYNTVNSYVQEYSDEYHLVPNGMTFYWPETPSLGTHLNDAMLSEVQSYSSLAFSQSSRWDDFLRAYYGISTTPALGEPELHSRFDEGSGRYAYDSSGNGHTATLYDQNGGQVAFSPDGKLGGCLEFWNQPLEWIGDYPPGTGYPGADVSYSDWQVCNFGLDLTITIWIKPMTVERPVQWIAAKQVNTAYYRVYSLGLAGSTPFFCIGNAGATDWLTWINGPSITPGTWHFIAVRRDASTGVAQMRVDDTWYSASIALPGTAYTAGQQYPRLHVGDTGGWDAGGGGRGFEGCIDDLRIFDETATYAEIIAIYNNFQPPSAPAGLVAIPGDGQVALSWDASASNGGKELLGYNIYGSQSPGPEILIQSVGPNTLTYTNTGLSNGQTYYYVVKAYNDLGESSPSNEVSVTLPVPPGAVPGLKATATTGKITLTWSAAPDGGSTVTKYNIYRATRSGQETLYASVDGTKLTFVDTGVSAGKTYYYKVTAVNAYGESPLATCTEVSAKVPR